MKADAKIYWVNHGDEKVYSTLVSNTTVCTLKRVYDVTEEEVQKEIDRWNVINIEYGCNGSWYSLNPDVFEDGMTPKLPGMSA